jgi:hypothetical protein
MALTVKIGDAATESEESEAPKLPPVTIRLNIKKTVDGNVLISDHPDVDIVITPKNKKIIVFPKEKISDKVYDIQDRFFKFLGRKGVILLDSIQGGNVYGSMEASYPPSEDVSALESVLLIVFKFMQEESRYFEIDEEFEEEFEKSLTEPDEDDSTELGEVPHADQKGSIRPGYIYSPYGISSIYRYE